MNLQYYRYYLSLSKNEKMFKTTNQTKKTKENDKKIQIKIKERKSFLWWESSPRP